MSDFKKDLSIRKIGIFFWINLYRWIWRVSFFCVFSSSRFISTFKVARNVGVKCGDLGRDKKERSRVAHVLSGRSATSTSTLVEDGNSTKYGSSSRAVQSREHADAIFSAILYLEGLGRSSVRHLQNSSSSSSSSLVCNFLLLIRLLY